MHMMRSSFPALMAFVLLLSISSQSEAYRIEAEQKH